uniref:Uncharacterized protein n=1 Tax=Anguilla anguilla TaxID=7936 RepID=A0A0E9T1H3_ANGAN
MAYEQNTFRRAGFIGMCGRCQGCVILHQGTLKGTRGSFNCS